MKKLLLATNMIKIGYLFLAVDLTCAGIFYFMHDSSRTSMFLFGAVFWILAILCWNKTKKDEEEQ